MLDYRAYQTKASTNGTKFASSTGEEISNLGEVMLPMITSEGAHKKMMMQAAGVSAPSRASRRSVKLAIW